MHCFTSPCCLQSDTAVLSCCLPLIQLSWKFWCSLSNLALAKSCVLSPTFHLPLAPPSTSNLMVLLPLCHVSDELCQLFGYPLTCFTCQIKGRRENKEGCGRICCLIRSSSRVQLNCTSHVYGLKVAGNLCLTWCTPLSHSWRCWSHLWQLWEVISKTWQRAQGAGSVRKGLRVKFW